jgi:hypothetical protein
MNHRALFESAKPVLFDPVRAVRFVERDILMAKPALAGEDAIAELTMLAAPRLTTYAMQGKLEDVQGTDSLIDRERQVRLELWRYSPVLLSLNRNSADPLSVIITLRREQDPRLEQAIESIYTSLWGEKDGK